ncbi:uncharacterized protein [Procambarus clarkii]|uniref:uncharacterized protein n=1 Tax=Procambarus clarkii TaxID=6728 RepID=UPI0037447001
MDKMALWLLLLPLLVVSTPAAVSLPPQVFPTPATTAVHGYVDTNTTFTRQQHQHVKSSCQHQTGDDVLHPGCHQLPCHILNTSKALLLPAVVSLVVPNQIPKWNPRLLFVDDRGHGQGCVDLLVHEGNISLHGKRQCNDTTVDFATVPLTLFREDTWIHFQAVVIGNKMKLMLCLPRSKRDLVTLPFAATRVQVLRMTWFGYSSLDIKRQKSTTQSPDSSLIVNSTSPASTNFSLPNRYIHNQTVIIVGACSAVCCVVIFLFIIKDFCSSPTSAPPAITHTKAVRPERPGQQPEVMVVMPPNASSSTDLPPITHYTPSCSSENDGKLDYSERTNSCRGSSVPGSCGPHHSVAALAESPYFHTSENSLYQFCVSE